jgi:competence protein ComEC
LRVLQISGRGAADRAARACAEADLVVLTVQAPAALPADCRIYDMLRLRRTGALAVWLQNGQPRLTTAAEVAGDRPWSPRPRPRRSPAKPKPPALRQADAGQADEGR